MVINPRPTTAYPSPTVQRVLRSSLFPTIQIIALFIAERDKLNWAIEAVGGIVGKRMRAYWAAKRKRKERSSGLFTSDPAFGATLRGKAYRTGGK
jgi:hypothetical protein